MGYTAAERAAYMNRYRESRRQWARKELGGRCVRCGSTDDLEFDHIDPGTKVAAMASMLTVSRERFEAEVRKCQLLCKEHHGEKSRAAYADRPSRWTHGKNPMYRKGGCRCAECVTGEKERRRNQYRRKQGSKEPGGSRVL